MADPKYPVSNNPTYNAEIRALQDNDPASASATFNPLVERLIENTHAVKLESDNIKEKISRGLFQLALTFSSSFMNRYFTITSDDGFTYQAMVPQSLSVNVDVPSPSTNYTVTCNGHTKKARTENYFGFYPVVFSVLNDNSWDQIASAAQAGTAETYWKVGDEKDITLSNGEKLTLQIYGFNHDDLQNGEKAKITFGLKHLMKQTRRMNSTNTNVGSFTSSEMYNWLSGTLYNSLPSELKSHIKPVDKLTSKGDKDTSIILETMEMFLFSEIECFGSVKYSCAGEGKQYEIFKDENNLSKKLSNGTGAVTHWWERSPYYSTGPFCAVKSKRQDTEDASKSTIGVCFGFCV